LNFVIEIPTCKSWHLNNEEKYTQKNASNFAQYIHIYSRIEEDKIFQNKFNKVCGALFRSVRKMAKSELLALSRTSMSACLSVCPQGTTRLPLEGFS
jgi:hypothetical protein